MGCMCRRVPPRQSCCALEADVVVGDILNRAAAVRTRLEDASPDSQLLDSLQPIWQVRLYEHIAHQQKWDDV